MRAGEESDSTTIDNRDLRLVMATVMRIIEDFLDRFPSFRVYFKGNDERKTRLYRIVISREISQLRQRFDVSGVSFEGTVPFQPDTEYSAFLVAPKTESQ